MSLQVWLPLNGNLNNQGLNNLQLTINTAPTYVDNGKIGKALSAGAVTMSAANAASILNNQEFSFACWIYVNADAGDTAKRAMLFGTSGMTAPNNRKFSIFQYPTCNDLHLSWQNDTNTTFTGGTWSGYFPSYKWTHVAITYKNPNGTIYINGEKKSTFSGVSNSPSFSFDTRLFENCANNGRYLNDYRIYDHALSAKEVEEIAMGLVLHYKLDNNGLGGDNFLTNSSFRTKINNFPSVSSSYTQTFEVIDGYECFHIHSDTLGISSSLGWNVKDLINAYPVGTKFTFSGWIKTDNIVKGTTNYFASLYYGGSYNNNGTSTWIGEGSRITSNPSSNSAFDLSGQGWKYCYIVSTFTRNDYTGMSALYYLRDFKGDIYLRNFKLEVGDKPTSWSPALSDLKIPNNIIYDSSGYFNQGSIIGSIEISNETPRYNASTYIKSSDPTTNSVTGEYYISGDISLMAPTAITISWWAKPENGYGGTINHAMWSTTANGISSDYQVSAFNHRDAGFDVNSSDGVHLRLSTSSFTKNEWHHYAVVYDGQTAYLYKDGIQQTSIAFSASKTLGNFTKILIGHSRAGGVHRKMLGKYSDFRVYCTALTAEQVKELYNTSATIDKNGNLYAREVIE